MLRAVQLVLALTLIGCAPPCEDRPLAPVRTTPAFVVELDRAVDAPSDAGLGVPGLDGGTPDAGAPSTTEHYAALALYAGDGTLVHEDWIDTRTRWQGARDTFDAHDVVPWNQRANRLAILLRDVPSIATFELSRGALSQYALVPQASDERLVDAFVIDDARALVSVDDGRLLVVDLAHATIVRTIDLRAYAGPAARAGRIAPLEGARVVLGLDENAGPDGAVALVDAESGAVTLVSVPGLRACSEVSAIAGGGVGVLCAGTGDPTTSTDAGLALLEGTVVAATRLASSISSVHPPTDSLVGMARGWVAVRSRGRGTADSLDALLAVHLASGAVQPLWEEAWSARFGSGLGEGAFAPELGAAGELWWPSATEGLLRFRIDGDGASARFVRQPTLATPGCLALPARRVRHLSP